MGFIRVDFVLRDVGTEGSEGSPSYKHVRGCRRAVQVMTVWAGADFVVRLEQCFQKIIIPSVSNYNSITITPGSCQGESVLASAKIAVPCCMLLVLRDVLSCKHICVCSVSCKLMLFVHVQAATFWVHERK